MPEDPSELPARAPENPVNDDPPAGRAPENSPPAGPLQIDAGEMRRLGYRVIDLIVDNLAGLRSDSAWQMYSREEGEARLRRPVPEEGTSFEAILDKLARDVLPFRGRIGHPRFMAFVPSSPNYVSMLGDALTAGFNPFVGTWLGGAGPAMLELVTIDWLRQMLALPEGTGGLFASGGSAATLIAIVAAREARLPGEDQRRAAVIYSSDQTHSCVARAARVAGFTEANLRTLPDDGAFRIDVAALEAAIAADRRRGLIPFMIVGNAGTTNTGAVDPLPELARAARDCGAWFHVDGAYGGFAALAPAGRSALAGLDLADSWVLDPHKWLYQGFECGSVLVRRPAELRAAFHVMPDYLRDVDMGKEQVNFGEYGFQLTRSWRALKVWMSLQYFGLARFRAAVERTLALARFAESIVCSAADMELLAPVQLGVVCFRFTRPGLSEEELEALNQSAQDRLNASGYALLSSTRLRGRFSLRLCILSPETTEDDVAGVFDRLRNFATVTGRSPRAADS